MQRDPGVVAAAGVEAGARHLDGATTGGTVGGRTKAEHALLVGTVKLPIHVRFASTAAADPRAVEQTGELLAHLFLASKQATQLFVRPDRRVDVFVGRLRRASAGSKRLRAASQDLRPGPGDDRAWVTLGRCARELLHLGRAQLQV